VAGTDITGVTREVGVVLLRARMPSGTCPVGHEMLVVQPFWLARSAAQQMQHKPTKLKRLRMHTWLNCFAGPRSAGPRACREPCGTAATGTLAQQGAGRCTGCKPWLTGSAAEWCCWHLVRACQVSAAGPASFMWAYCAAIQV